VLGGHVAYDQLDKIGCLRKPRFRQQVWRHVREHVELLVSKQMLRQVQEKTRDRITHQVSLPVEKQLQWKVGNQIEQEVEQQVELQVKWQVGKRIEQQVAQNADKQIEQCVYWDVWKQLSTQIKEHYRVAREIDSEVEEKIWDQVQEQIANQVSLYEVAIKHGLSIYDYSASQLWVAWHAYISFFVENGLLEPSPVIDAWKLDRRLTETSGFTWWSADVLAISDRPIFIKRNLEGRLHSENGYAIEYPDGWGIACWHGVQIPVEWVSGSLPSPKDALTWHNIEQRRAAIELIGWPRILTDVNAKIIDRSADPLIGELIEVTLPDLDAPARFLRYRCGTGREFASGVPPYISTAVEAQAWFTGLDAKSFRLPSIRT
jgi:hypothetical protein